MRTGRVLGEVQGAGRYARHKRAARFGPCGGPGAVGAASGRQVRGRRRTAADGEGTGRETVRNITPRFLIHGIFNTWDF